MIGLALIIILIIAVVVYLIKNKNQNQNQSIGVPLSLPEGAIIFKPGQSMNFPPHVKISYTKDASVCLAYVIDERNSYLICERMTSNVTSLGSNHFVVLNKNLAFDLYTGDPLGIFNPTGVYGFGIGYLANKLGDLVTKSNTLTKDSVVTDIINSVRQVVGQPDKVIEITSVKR
jgi:hypothetical protein